MSEQPVTISLGDWARAMAKRTMELGAQCAANADPIGAFDTLARDLRLLANSADALDRRREELQSERAAYARVIAGALASVAPVPETGYLRDGGPVLAGEDLRHLRAEHDRLKVDCDNLRGAMAAQDERERLAGERCGISCHEHGCDWPDRMADEVLGLRDWYDSEWKRDVELTRLRAERDNALAAGQKLAQKFLAMWEEDNQDAAAALMAEMKPLAEELAAGQVPTRGCCEYWAVVEKRPDGKPYCEKIRGNPTLHYTREGAERALAEDILPITNLRGCFEVRPVYLSWLPDVPAGGDA